MHLSNIAHKAGNAALRYDAQTGTFDNEKANRLIKDTYCQSYELPDKV